SELTEWKIELYSSREWMERGADTQIFAPLPGEPEEAVNPRLSDIEGLEPATVAVLEEAGYRTLDDIIDLEREDFLRLAGIAPEEADRLMTIINELTEEGGEPAAGETRSAASESEIPEPPAAAAAAAEGAVPPAESGAVGSEGGAGDATSAGDGDRSATSDAAAPPAESGAKKGE
ncbi:MAG TPA: helix-hairpin-helix domain-containing protein, partial [Thermoanaerobaculia bacterium]|nr:helix-hairpin-helix domain-containing protein [Thermoanaerobaculia bacterium]